MNETGSVEHSCAETVPGFVYFMDDGDCIKIGFTTDIEGRRRTLQTSHSKTLTVLRAIPGVQADERSLHSHFASLRVRGEWFRRHRTLLKFIAEAGNATQGGVSVLLKSAEQPMHRTITDEIPTAPGKFYAWAEKICCGATPGHIQVMAYQAWQGLLHSDHEPFDKFAAAYAQWFAPGNGKAEAA